MFLFVCFFCVALVLKKKKKMTRKIDKSNLDQTMTKPQAITPTQNHRYNALVVNTHNAAFKVLYTIKWTNANYLYINTMNCIRNEPNNCFSFFLFLYILYFVCRFSVYIPFIIWPIVIQYNAIKYVIITMCNNSI